MTPPPTYKVEVQVFVDATSPDQAIEVATDVLRRADVDFEILEESAEEWDG